MLISSADSTRRLCRLALLTVVPALSLVLSVPEASAANSTSSSSAASLLATTGSAGTNVGNAGQLTGTSSGSLPSGAADDWWVIYPAVLGATVNVGVTNTTTASASCTGLSATLYGSNGASDSLDAVGVNEGSSYQLTGSEPASDRYFVQVTIWGNCNPPLAVSVTYTLTLGSGGGGTPPNPATGSIRAGSSIGSAWPPLQGHTAYTGTVSSGSSDLWYSLYKKPDTNPATIRIENTTVAGSTTCNDLFVTIDASGGSSETVNGANVIDNGAFTFSVPANASTDPTGLYYIELTDGSCTPGGTTYSIEPEPSGEFNNPARVPAGSITAGDSIASATPPLQGHATYTGTVSSGSSDLWYSLYKKPDTNPATIRIENTTVAGSTTCNDLFVTIDAAGGRSETVDGANVIDNGAFTFSVPANASTDPTGLYYIELGDGSCTPGGTTYSIEPEPSGEFNNPTPYPSEPLPPGSSMANAGGPLAGGDQYTGTISSAATQNWDFVDDNGSVAVAYLTVENTTSNLSNCLSLFVTLVNSSGSTVASADVIDNSAYSFAIDVSGDFYVEVTDGNCDPGSSPLPSYVVEATPSTGFTPEAQVITFTTSPPSSPIVGNTYTVRATASSGLPVALSIDSSAATVCSISGSTSGSIVTFRSTGTCTIDANQAGNPPAILPAPQAQQMIKVSQGLQIVASTNWDNNANITYRSFGVVVGEQVKVAVQLHGANTASATWTIPGAGSTLPSVIAPPGLALNGGAPPLLTNLATNPITFDVAGGITGPLKISVKVPVNGQNVSASATLDVVKVQLSSPSVNTCRVGAINATSIFQRAPGFGMGYNDNCGATAGITWNLTPKIAAFSTSDVNSNTKVNGVFGMSQLINNASGFNGTACVNWGTGGAHLADNGNLYVQGTPSTGSATVNVTQGSTNETWSGSDSPGMGGFTTQNSANLADDFWDYTMFRPAGGSWVPLGGFLWNFSAAITLAGGTATLDAGATWPGQPNTTSSLPYLSWSTLTATTHAPWPTWTRIWTNPTPATPCA
jgi:hypothetical protein